MGNDPETYNLIKILMKECQSVGEKIGVKFSISIDDRIKVVYQLLDINLQQLRT